MSSSNATHRVEIANAPSMNELAEVAAGDHRTIDPSSDITHDFFRLSSNRGEYAAVNSLI